MRNGYRIGVTGIRYRVRVTVWRMGYGHSVTGLRRSLAPGLRDARTAAIGASQTGLRRSLAPGHADARTAAIGASQTGLRRSLALG